MFKKPSPPPNPYDGLKQILMDNIEIGPKKCNCKEDILPPKKTLLGALMPLIVVVSVLASILVFQSGIIQRVFCKFPVARQICKACNSFIEGIALEDTLEIEAEDGERSGSSAKRLSPLYLDTIANGLWGYHDKKKWVIDPQFAKASKFKNGKASVIKIHNGNSISFEINRLGECIKNCGWQNETAEQEERKPRRVKSRKKKRQERGRRAKPSTVPPPVPPPSIRNRQASNSPEEVVEEARKRVLLTETEVPIERKVRVIPILSQAELPDDVVGTVDYGEDHSIPAANKPREILVSNRMIQAISVQANHILQITAADRQKPQLLMSEIQDEYEEVKNVSSELFAVRRGAKWGLLHRTKHVRLVDFHLDEVHIMSDSLVRVKCNGKYGFVNNNGLFIKTKQMLDAAEDFKDGKARVRAGNDWFRIDKSGKNISQTLP